MLTHVATSARSGCADVCRVHFRRARVLSNCLIWKKSASSVCGLSGTKVGRGASAGYELRTGESSTQVKHHKERASKMVSSECCLDHRCHF